MPIPQIPEIIYQDLLLPNSAVPIERIRSGLSNSVVLRCSLPTGFACLRCWQPSHSLPTSLLAIRDAIDVATRSGVDFVPKFFANRDQTTYVSDGERTWELTQWMPGAADYLRASSAMRLQAALHALAELHLAWSENSRSDTSPAALQRLRILSEISTTNAMASWLDHAQDDIERELVKQTVQCVHRYGPELLQQVRRLAAEPTRLYFAIRDIWSDHVLFTDDKVTGIIDFGALRIDEPATDLARLLGSLEPVSREMWQRGLGYYQELNRAVDPARVVILDRIACLLSAVQWAKWLVIERRRFDVPNGVLLTRWRGFLDRLCNFDWGL